MWIEGLNEEIAELKEELEEIEELKAEVEKLKAELLDINAKHHRDTQKTCLKAKFDTWRLECDHELNWSINQLYMDDEGEYTLTEEEWEKNQTSETNPAEIYMSDTARGIEHSTGSPKKKRVIVRWYENGVAVEKMLMRKRGYCHSHKTEAQHYAPAPTGGVEPTENGWKCCDKSGDMVFIENGKYVNGHYLADFKQ